MKTPICKLCGKARWSYEDHYTGTSAISPDYIKEMAKGAMGYEKRITVFPDESPPETTTTESRRPPTIVTQKTCNACNACNACRQRTYRERSK